MSYEPCMCGGCSECRPELGRFCDVHGPGNPPEPDLCELCIAETEKRAAEEEARLDAEDAKKAWETRYVEEPIDLGWSWESFL